MGPIIILLLIAAIGGIAFFVSPDQIKKKIPNLNVFQSEPTKPVVNQPAGIVELTVVSSQQNVTKGQTFTVNVEMDPKTEKVSAAEIHLSFDPAQLEATEVKAGSLLTVELAPGKTGSGTASITLGSKPDAPVSEKGTIATVTFKALTNATAKITLNPHTQVAAIGKTDNVVGTLGSTQITINP